MYLLPDVFRANKREEIGKDVLFPTLIKGHFYLHIKMKNRNKTGENPFTNLYKTCQ